MGESLPSSLLVVGIGADGWSGLSELARERIGAAEVLVAGSRVQALVPEVSGQVREDLPSPLRAGLRELMASYAGRSVAVVASGDPMVSGIGSTLVDLFGAEAVEVLPARLLGGPRPGTDALVGGVEPGGLAGRARPAPVLRQLAPSHHVLVLSSDETTPAFVAALLTSYGYGASRVVVLGDLGSAEESRTEGTAATWSAESPRLNVIALDLEDRSSGPGPPACPTTTSATTAS